MPKKPARRSKEDHNRVVVEARKRFKLKQREMKDLFKKNGEELRVQQDILMATTFSCTTPEDYPEERAVVAIVIQSNASEACGTIRPVAGDFIVPLVSSATDTTSDELDEVTGVVCEEFVRSGVSYVKFNGGG
jgi:signal transduction protein with GAF and PtsI domain